MIDYNVTEKPSIETFYNNRTRLYLLPAVNLLKSLSEIAKLKKNITAVTTNFEGGLNIYIKANDMVRSLVSTLKQNKELIDEYIYSKNIHVVCVRPPIDYDAFLQGEYSRIYTKDQLVRCFDSKSEVLKILTKDPSYFKSYVQFIKKQFGEEIREDVIKEHKEFDMPPNINQEII